MKQLYRIPEPAQEFCEAPRMLRDGPDVRLRFDYERPEGSYGQKDIVFRNCGGFRFLRESEIAYTEYRAAYNAVACDGREYHVFFDGYGLYSFRAEGFRDCGDCFAEAIDAVRAWFKRQDGTEVREDSRDRLWAFFDRSHCMAELLVCRAESAPFRYVSFQVVDVRAPKRSAPVYVFYDGPDSVPSQILAGVEEGIRVMGERV